MDSKEGEEGDEAFDEAVLNVQQQISAYKESTSKKLRKLEATIEIARQKMQEILSIKTQRLGEGFMNPLGWQSDEKSNYSKPSYRESETLQQLNLRFSKHEEGSVVFETIDGIGNETREWPIPVEEEIVEWKEELPALQKEKGMFGDTSQIALETYIGEPIYDNEPEEGQECWTGHEFILAALMGDNSNSPDILHSQLCTSEGLEAYLKSEPNQTLEDGDKPKLVGFKGEETQGVVEEESSVIHTNKREELIEDVLCKDNPTAMNSCDLLKRSTNFGRRKMLTFDPGGQVQNKQLKGRINKSKQLIRSEVNLEEAGMKTSAGSQLRHWQNIDFLAIEQLLKEPSQLQTKVFIIEIENSTRLQGQGQKIQKETDRLDKILSEINQHIVDYVRVGWKVLTYKYKYIVFMQCSPEMNKSMRHAYHEASGKSIIIYIFDPGGDSSCLYGVSIGIPNSQQLLQDVLHGKEL